MHDFFIVKTYSAIPGDMADAYNYWGAAIGCTNNSVGSVSSGCNGDGNGWISLWYNEGIRAPQHLSYAGLIPGTYDGSGINTGCNSGGSNCLHSKSFSAYYHFTELLNAYGVTRGNVIQVASMPTGNNPSYGAFSPTEAQAIDLKIDDGIATRGWLFSSIAGGQATDGTKCVTADLSSASANWVFSDTTKSCRLFYWITK